MEEEINEQEQRENIEANVGDDSRETIELVDDTPEIELQDLAKKITKLERYIDKTNSKIAQYEEKLQELVDIEDDLKIQMKREVLGANDDTSMYISV